MPRKFVVFAYFKYLLTEPPNNQHLEHPARINNCSPLELLRLQNNLIKIAEREGISFVYEKRQNKSEIQLLYKEL